MAQATVSGYTCFGIPFASGFKFPGAWRAGEPAPDATVVKGGRPPAWPGDRDGGWDGIVDDERFTVSRSTSDEYRFVHGERTLFHLSADRRTLLADPGPVRDVRWWRALLDSVLFTVSLLRGNEALHAGAVATSSGALAIVAPSGGGKSTLVRQMLTDGHRLVTDDILFLEAAEEQVLAHPGPPLMTLPVKPGTGVGTPLDTVGDEVWAAVPVVSDPVPLRRIVLLDRRPGSPVAMCKVERPLAPLMAHLLNFPRTSERELSRFSLASALATQAEIWNLIADVKTPPSELAARVLQGLSA